MKFACTDEVEGLRRILLATLPESGELGGGATAVLALASVRRLAARRR